MDDDDGEFVTLCACRICMMLQVARIKMYCTRPVLQHFADITEKAFGTVNTALVDTVINYLNDRDHAHDTKDATAFVGDLGAESQRLFDGMRTSKQRESAARRILTQTLIKPSKSF